MHSAKASLCPEAAERPQWPRLYLLSKHRSRGRMASLVGDCGQVLRVLGWGLTRKCKISLVLHHILLQTHMRPWNEGATNNGFARYNMDISLLLDFQPKEAWHLVQPCNQKCNSKNHWKTHLGSCFPSGSKLGPLKRPSLNTSQSLTLQNWGIHDAATYRVYWSFVQCHPCMYTLHAYPPLQAMKTTIPLMEMHYIIKID